MKKLMSIVLFIPMAALAQYGGGGGGNTNSNAPVNTAPSSGASRIQQKSKPAPVEAEATSTVAIEKFTPAAIEPPPAPNPCKRPDLASVKISKKEEGDAFNARNANYRDCVQDFVNAQKVASEQHSAAANATVQEFNAFSAELNEKFGKSK